METFPYYLLKVTLIFPAMTLYQIHLQYQQLSDLDLESIFNKESVTGLHGMMHNKDDLVILDL